ncbi:MAG: sel1 repeat family protein, partial [Synergistaceae bacterium]|nr:sel1 repeat family protein [Synergistaceae bacterium]
DLFNKSAAKGNSEAQYNLGVMYFNGLVEILFDIAPLMVHETQFNLCFCVALLSFLLKGRNITPYETPQIIRSITNANAILFFIMLNVILSVRI